jgi:hypothetical protein
LREQEERRVAEEEERQRREEEWQRHEAERQQREVQDRIRWCGEQVARTVCWEYRNRHEVDTGNPFSLLRFLLGFATPRGQPDASRLVRLAQRLYEQGGEFQAHWRLSRGDRHPYEAEDGDWLVKEYLRLNGYREWGGTR